MNKWTVVFIMWAFMLVFSTLYSVYITVEDDEDGIMTNKQLDFYLAMKFPRAERMIVDAKYFLINKSDVSLYLAKNPINKRRYIDDVYDCDDFAFDLWRGVRHQYGNIAFGVISINENITSKHCLNFFIDENKEFYFVEPQNDKIYKENEMQYDSVNWLII